MDSQGARGSRNGLDGRPPAGARFGPPYRTRTTRAATKSATRIWLLLVTIALGCTSRPPVPPPGAIVTSPYGAIDIDELHFGLNSAFERSLELSFQAEPPGEFDVDGDGIREYSLLALSGGGSKGAFGAGLLCGWSESGSRPDFKVVSGVSTGALQATFAFLGPDYDDVLREVYTFFDTRDIYRKRWKLAGLISDSINDTWPLGKLIDRCVTKDVLAEVAKRHAAGHRLFVGTTNLDTSEFIIWDMGKIASSGRSDALDLYRRVLLASCSIPVLFPPVYFEVESAGETYYEMHVDGGTYAQLFFFFGASCSIFRMPPGTRVSTHLDFGSSSTSS